MANGVKVTLKVIFKTIQQVKIQVFPRIKVSLGGCRKLNVLALKWNVAEKSTTNNVSVYRVLIVKNRDL